MCARVRRGYIPHPRHWEKLPRPRRGRRSPSRAAHVPFRLSRHGDNVHPVGNLLSYGDNLDILQRYVADESVDLVSLDPPFNSNATYDVLFAEQGGAPAANQIILGVKAGTRVVPTSMSCAGVIEARAPLSVSSSQCPSLQSQCAKRGGGRLLPRGMGGAGRFPRVQLLTVAKLWTARRGSKVRCRRDKCDLARGLQRPERREHAANIGSHLELRDSDATVIRYYFWRIVERRISHSDAMVRIKTSLDKAQNVLK